MARDPMQRYQSAEEFSKALLGDNDVSLVVDSFHPPTLSMIGEHSSAHVMSQCEPVSTRGTGKAQGAVSAAEPWAARVTQLSRLGLALFAIGAVYTFVAAVNNRAGAGLIDGFALTLAALLASWMLAFTFRRGIASRSALGKTRIRTWFFERAAAAAFSTGTFLGFTGLTTSIEPEGLTIACLGCFIAMVLVGWRHAFSLHQSREVPWLRLLMLVAIPAAIAYTLGFETWCLFSASTAMAIFWGSVILSQRPTARTMHVEMETAGDRVSPGDRQVHEPAGYRPRMQLAEARVEGSAA